jgi:hypothetical protein
VASKATTKQVESIIASASETVPIDTVKPYRKNPRVGDIGAIRESLRQNGQFRPIVVQKSTKEILGGNHTWRAAKEEGWTLISAVFVDVDDDAAKRIVLADNRTNDLASYNADILSEILSSLPDPVGTGYDSQTFQNLVQAVQDRDQEAIEDVIRPPIQVGTLLDDGEIGPEGDNSVTGPTVDPNTAFESPEDDVEDLRDELGELQGILQLREDMTFKSSNYYDIPDLVSSGLVQALPDPLDTWGGSDATPDDGKTTWLWNYGVASKKDLPFDRAILCFYTYDTYFESFWDQPAFMTAKVLNAGIKMAVVPDFSFYTDMACATWVFNTYRAQWLGRYFQEAGIKVIPRIQFAIDKDPSRSWDFCTAGIPKGAPVVAKSTQNSNSKDEFDLEVKGLEVCLQKVEPKTLLMYGGNPAGRVIEALDPVKKGLCENVVHIMNYAHKRRGVVFDKKEGLAGKRKDEKRQSRDKATQERDSRKPTKVAQAEPEPETADAAL